MAADQLTYTREWRRLIVLAVEKCDRYSARKPIRIAGEVIAIYHFPERGCGRTPSVLDVVFYNFPGQIGQ